MPKTAYFESKPSKKHKPLFAKSQRLLAPSTPVFCFGFCLRLGFGGLCAFVAPPLVGEKEQQGQHQNPVALRETRGKRTFGDAAHNHLVQPDDEQRKRRVEQENVSQFHLLSL